MSTGAIHSEEVRSGVLTDELHGVLADHVAGRPVPDSEANLKLVFMGHITRLKDGTHVVTYAGHVAAAARPGVARQTLIV
jgi:hypothetical protein